jgi:hypothetical protein
VRKASFQKFAPGNALGTRIEEEPIGKLESRAHHLDLTLARLVRVGDRLHGLWTQVVAGGEVGLFETGLHLKTRTTFCLSDLRLNRSHMANLLRRGVRPPNYSALILQLLTR